MDAKLTDDFSETILTFMIALNQQGDYAATSLNVAVRQYLDSGCRFEYIEPLVKRLKPGALGVAANILAEAQNLGITVLCPVSADYPEELRQIPDPPLALFIRGRIKAPFAVGIVGARRCSEYGKKVSFELGKVVAAAGGCAVSGLAFGIDAAAHRGAIRGSGRYSTCPTIAVLGSGVCDIYPAEHRLLADEILRAGGALVSEYGLTCLPRRHYFPRRNRIISGLSRKVVIVEAAERSGSLITARLALEQGRDLATVPGEIDSPLSAGTNELLAQGAELIARPEDVLDGMPAVVSDDDEQAGLPVLEVTNTIGVPDELRSKAGELLRFLRLRREASFEDLLLYAAIPAHELRTLLLQLELSGAVNPLGNGYSLGEGIKNPH